MMQTGKRTTKGFSFFIQLLTAAFIVALMAFTLGELGPVTDTRVAECQQRIEAAEEQLVGASDQDTATLNARIDMYTNRITMLRNRDKYYALSMMLLVCVLLAGAVMQSFKTASFQTASHLIDAPTKDYYMHISAPLSAVCILISVGLSYQVIFGMDLKDLLLLIAAIVAGVVAFTVYRRMPYTAAKLRKKYLYLGVGPQENRLRVSAADLLFLAPAVGIVGLLGILLLFGDTVNGAKINLSVGGFAFQPCEFVKVLLVILFASAYGKTWRALVAIGVSFLSILAMMLIRDMGAAFVVLAMLVIMLFLLLDNKMTFSWYESKKLLLILLILAIGAFPLLLSFFPYAQERFGNVGAAMEPGNPITQQADMLKALIFGGLGGLGIENSSYIINIPAIHNDMAIAGLTAVFGYGMLLVVLLCYALLIVIPIRKHAVYRQFYFLTAQVAVVLLVQAVFNALGSVDVLPFTGIVAPFLSSGGSALISFCAMAGLVLATLHPTIKPLEVNSR